MEMIVVINDIQYFTNAKRKTCFWRNNRERISNCSQPFKESFCRLRTKNVTKFSFFVKRIPPLFPGTNVLLIEILTPLDVRREVDLFRQLGDVNFEPILNFIKDFGVRLVRDEGDGKALELWNKMSSIINGYVSHSAIEQIQQDREHSITSLVSVWLDSTLPNQKLGWIKTSKYCTNNQNKKWKTKMK